MLLLQITFALILVSVLVCACIGKEFPDMRPSERTEFIRVGYAVRTAGQPKGEPRATHQFLEPQDRGDSCWKAGVR